MVKCHLSTLMGAKKMNIADVASATGLHRNTVSAFYHEKAERIELAALEKLCILFECKVGEILEYQGASNASSAGEAVRRNEGNDEQ